VNRQARLAARQRRRQNQQRIKKPATIRKPKKIENPQGRRRSEAFMWVSGNPPINPRFF
jgi:hypothetical protein